jgi:hypothetical protein
MARAAELMRRIVASLFRKRRSRKARLETEVSA